MNIFLGSASSIKINAIEEVLSIYTNTSYILNGKEVLSNVPNTPFNDQTYLGAENRAKAILNLYFESGDLFVGLESGIMERQSFLFEECWCCILDKNNNKFISYSSGFPLPDKISKRMSKGEAHMDIINEYRSLMEVEKKDTWAVYTNQRLSRTESFKEAFRNAFLLYLNK